VGFTLTFSPKWGCDNLGLGFRELEVACDQIMSHILFMQINILLDFFIVDMGALGGLEVVFSH
jgi:hypothetical protein